MFMVNLVHGGEVRVLYTPYQFQLTFLQRAALMDGHQVK
jgi:hypothetical protein